MSYQENWVILNFEACVGSSQAEVPVKYIKFYTRTCSDISLSFMTDLISLDVFPLAPATTIARAVLIDIGDMNTF